MSYMSAKRANEVEIDFHELYANYLCETDDEEPMAFAVWLYSKDSSDREMAIREYLMEGPDA